MSDTPRTDAHYKQILDDDLGPEYAEKGVREMMSYIEMEYAKTLKQVSQLERELAEARGQLHLCNVDQFTTERELAEAQRNYMDLIMSVEKAYPNETRHQTALRYIRERETPSTDAKLKDKNT